MGGRSTMTMVGKLLLSGVILMGCAGMGGIVLGVATGLMWVLFRLVVRLCGVEW